MNQKRIALRMERQHLSKKATEKEYGALYRDLQPGQNVYWNGFGDPPTLSHRVGFDDKEWNRRRQKNRALVKGRFAGGNLGWIERGDMELFACLYQKPLSAPNDRQQALLGLIHREGPMTIQQMKASTGMLVKEITPALHRLQEAFLIYEDQNEGQDDRGWYKFSELFPEVGLSRYSRRDALKVLLQRYAYRMVEFDGKMAKSFFRVPEKELSAALEEMVRDRVLQEEAGNFILASDAELLKSYSGTYTGVLSLHRNDILVKSYEHILKGKFPHEYPDTLHYLLIDGELRGAVVGKFRYTPELEDVILELPEGEAEARREEILQATRCYGGEENPVKRYQGVLISDN